MPEKKKLTVYLPANTVENEGLAGPRFAVVDFTEQLIARIRELCGLVVTHKLSEVREWGGVDEWDQRDELRLTADEMVVVDDAFWFRASFRHGDGYAETRSLRVESDLQGIEKALQEGREDFYACTEADFTVFKSMIEDSRATIDG